MSVCANIQSFLLSYLFRDFIVRYGVLVMGKKFPFVVNTMAGSQVVGSQVTATL